MIRVPRGLLLWLLAGTGCSANKGSDSGTPKQTVADLELRFAVLDDTNADGKLTPGESGFLHFIIQNNGDQNLVEIMGSVELHDDRLSGWYHEERWWGMAFADASNSDANILTGQSYYGEEVTLDRFDAGEAGTRINGTADLYEPCRKPDYWIFPRQDEWILHWCQENKADAYPVYRGPVSLLIENAPSGEDGVSLRSATVTSDTNDNGEAEARESVAWGMEVVLTREGEISGLSGTIQCADPYFETPVSTSFDGRSLYETGEGFGVEVWGTLREDTPPGHVFTFELQAVDEMGDQFTATIQTPPVGESSAQPAFVSVEAPDFFDFSEAGGATASTTATSRNTREPITEGMTAVDQRAMAKRTTAALVITFGFNPCGLGITTSNRLAKKAALKISFEGDLRKVTPNRRMVETMAWITPRRTGDKAFLPSTTGEYAHVSPPGWTLDRRILFP